MWVFVTMCASASVSIWTHFLFPSSTPSAFPGLQYDSEWLLWNLILWYHSHILSSFPWDNAWKERTGKGMYHSSYGGCAIILCAKTGVSRSACTNTQTPRLPHSSDWNASRIAFMARAAITCKVSHVAVRHPYAWADKQINAHLAAGKSHTLGKQWNWLIERSLYLHSASYRRFFILISLWWTLE